MLLLAQNPMAQTRVREEVIQAVAKTGAEPYECFIDREDTFLAACVVESARLRPILRELIPLWPYNGQSSRYLPLGFVSSSFL